MRQPKVYNAVITTDDNLQPSRAFPVVQPVLETGYGGYPFSYLGGYPQFHGNYDFSQFYNKFNQQPQFHEVVDHIFNSKIIQLINTLFFKQKNDQPLEQQPEEPNQEDKPIDKKSQIPLNNHGLPPSLIPLPTYGNQHYPQQRPISLQPFPFSNYPLTYDPFGGYNQNPYLPPFNGYYPSISPQNPGNENKEEEENKNDEKEKPEVENPEDQKPEETTTQKKIDETTEQDVKNITKKDKNIPDVPPPPIPSGGNNKE